MKLVPSLDNVRHDPTPDLRIWATRITLPSSFNDAQRQVLGLSRLAKIEIDLRIGHGHDALDKLRKALGVRSFLTRQTRSQQSGYSSYTRGQAEIRRAQSVVKQWGHTYRRNWDALVALDINPSDPMLKGLQELKSSDLKLLGAWLDDEQYRNPQSNLPWIWRVSPLGIDGLQQMDDEVAEMVADWNQEGEFIGVMTLP